eukprot:s2781_g4.t1
MANMSPEDMQKMTQMAANMDPSESMMKNMGGAAAGGIDSNQMKEQMKRIGEMSPEELKSTLGLGSGMEQRNMNQAQQQYGGQKQYMYNASMTLKNQGNDHIKAQKYADALKAYSKALENLKPFGGDDVSQLRLSLLLNSAMCHLKQKEPEKTLQVCEEALQINSKSVKALFRRGLARVDLGQHAEGVGDMKFASKLSPEDKTITSELERVEKEILDKGVSAADIAAAAEKAEAASNTAAAGASSSSSSWPAAGNMEKAMEQLSSNPEMLNQATEAMKNLSPEDLERMMQSAPLPPGVDAETARKRMEAVSKNPEMLKSAMETFKNIPEEDRKKMMAAAQGQPGGMPDMSKMSDVLKDPEMMKTAMAAAGSGPEADMMKKMTENPEMMDAMTNMMKNMPPEQMQKMMEMSMKMKSGGADPKDASQMLNDPEMMKAAEEMMKSISPEALQSMAKSAGIEVSESHAKMMSKVMPYLMKCLKLWGFIKRMFAAMFSARGRMILAAVILFVAVGQHYLFSSGEK